MQPTIGRIVHFRLPDHPETGEARWRPGLVTEVMPSQIETMPPIDTYVLNMNVHLDGRNDSDMAQLEGGKFPLTVWRDNVTEGTSEGCWRWPPRV